MGRRGPIPKPGSSESKRGRNTRYAKARPSSGDVRRPAWLVDENAVAFWDEHAARLVDAHRLRPEHADTFATLCELAGDCRRLAARVATEGDIIETEKGPIGSPAARLLRDARRDFVNLARDFGMTAAADARLPIETTDGKEEDADETLLRAFTRGA